MERVELVECPRDAMQGLDQFIPTDVKVSYLQGLLDVGFDVIDIGSFVSPKAIPQMRDTSEVLHRLNLTNTRSDLLVIVANQRGAEDACRHEMVDYLGYPFSISDTFQRRNTNTDIEGSFDRTARIVEHAHEHGKKVVVYISMAFGNPYGDEWNKDIASHWVGRLIDELQVDFIALADTVGVASPKDIEYMFSSLIPAFPDTPIGAHLHATPDNWELKVAAAWDGGCRRFDGALKGYGGCPMAEDVLVGNVAMENLYRFFSEKEAIHHIDADLLSRSLLASSEVFPG
jgi:hydroxymethylglutaryl-CoA lyase